MNVTPRKLWAAAYVTINPRVRRRLPNITRLARRLGLIKDDLVEAARGLAMIALQQNEPRRYALDTEYQEAVDHVLALTDPRRISI